MAARKPDLFNKDIENLLHPWTHQGAHLANGPLVLEKADGVYIYDSEGNRLQGSGCLHYHRYTPRQPFPKRAVRSLNVPPGGSMGVVSFQYLY